MLTPLYMKYFQPHLASETAFSPLHEKEIERIYISRKSTNHYRQDRALSWERKRTGGKAPKHVTLDIRSSSHDYVSGTRCFR